MRGVLLSSLLLIGLYGSAQTVLYRTRAEHLAGKGEERGNVLDVMPAMGRLVLVLETPGGRERVPCKDLWGFTYQGVLFRIEPGSGLPVRLMSHHTLCYYENGLAHLTMQRERTEAATFEFGDAAYLSTDLDGTIVPARFRGKDIPVASRRFDAAHPELESLITCIGAGAELEHIRQCVVDHEVSVEEKR
ncbi:MAG TPA: hypothetical protein VGE21_06030 [Flavobacteriales bacterium]